MARGILLAAGLCLGLVGGVAEAGTLPGDADCSGQVDSLDAQAILALDVGLRRLPTICTTNADVDGSGRITPVDSLWILWFDSGIVSEFPVQ